MAKTELITKLEIKMVKQLHLGVLLKHQGDAGQTGRSSKGPTAENAGNRHRYRRRHAQREGQEAADGDSHRRTRRETGQTTAGLRSKQ